jgi:DNA repair exonuclease SbcCD ATPase subunit
VLEEDYKLAMTETVIAQSTWEGHEKARDEYKASMTDLTATIEQREKVIRLRNIIIERENAIADAQAEQRRLVAQVKAKRDEPNPFTAMIDGADDTITDKTDFVQVCKDMLAAVVQDLKVHTAAAQVFGPAGVRAFLLDEVTPFLNEQTAKYLGTLSDGNLTATWTTLVKTAKGELREKFAVELESVSAGGTFKSISGGEKRKVRIACAFALSDLVARRASKPIELFIGDEIDDALDSAGLERLTTILEEKGKERGTVLVISHRDLKSWIKQSITIKKSGGVATLVEAA